MALNGQNWQTMQESHYHHQTAPNVLTVNLGLKWPHIVAIATIISSGIAALIGAGWFVLPAKQTDLVALEKQVSAIETDVKETAGDIRRIQNDISGLIVLIKGVDSYVRTVEMPLPQKR